MKLSFTFYSINTHAQIEEPHEDYKPKKKKKKSKSTKKLSLEEFINS